MLDVIDPPDFCRPFAATLLLDATVTVGASSLRSECPDAIIVLVEATLVRVERRFLKREGEEEGEDNGIGASFFCGNIDNFLSCTFDMEDARVRLLVFLLGRRLGDCERDFRREEEEELSSFEL